MSTISTSITTTHVPELYHCIQLRGRGNVPIFRNRSTQQSQSGYHYYTATGNRSQVSLERFLTIVRMPDHQTNWIGKPPFVPKNAAWCIGAGCGCHLRNDV